MGDNERLERIERLLALNLIDDKDTLEAVKLLHLSNYNSKEIGELIGISASTVRDKISDLRESGEINA